ncbi:hypothetical protein QR680_011290 [Steinernema hermaphroditum]|uniref:Protein kinase domain-containing protein n=1 Tax=Steinernema hermaphroditum TaxID=289476 RepID=A0AA39IRS2_9BILA|nr:hypothetical protein QR680_011290 [Steinernema hermaphroditum]
MTLQYLPVYAPEAFYCAPPEEPEPLPSQLLFNGDVFRITKQLGSGGFGTVHTMTNARGMRIAVKTIQESGEDVLKEVAIWSQLRHPNIVQFFEYQRLPTLHFLLMEHAAHGDLFTFINDKHAQLTPWLRHRIVRQLVEAVTFIHASGFVHCDIKPENVLFADPNVVKICDFGLARPISRDEYGRELQDMFAQGTVHYYTPEKYYWRPSFSTKDDIWALGVTILSMAIGSTPWMEPSEQDQDFKIWKCDPMSRPCYEQLYRSDRGLFDLIRNMLHPQEGFRWNALQSHPVSSFLHTWLHSKDLWS